MREADGIDAQFNVTFHGTSPKRVVEKLNGKSEEDIARVLFRLPRVFLSNLVFGSGLSCLTGYGSARGYCGFCHLCQHCPLEKKPLQALAPTVDNRSSTKSLDTLDNTYQSDGTNTVESTLTESMTQSKSSGSVTTGGNISTLGTTQISVNDKINAVFGVSMKQGLTKNNFRPTQYDYVAARCGGVNPRDIEKDIAMNGVMSMENLISVESAALDCRMELMAIGTIDIGIPKPSTVSGYSVAVSVTGEIIDLRDGVPFSIAAFGPVQQNDGGVDEATAIRNAIANAGTKTAIELANILDANGIR